MISLNFSAVHKFIREQRRLGSDIRWDGWELVFFKPTRHGWSNKKGAYRNGRWGMESRVTVTNAGLWNVPTKNVRPVR